MIDGDTTMNKDLCPVCGSTNISVFFEIFRVPIHCNQLWSTRDEAIGAPTGDIQLGFCQDCKHIFNIAFDAELVEYSQNYDNSLHFSPRFQNYAQSLAARLINCYDLHEKDIIEIGCGRGEFLRLLCKLGGNRGFGFDPSYAPQYIDDTTLERITFIQDVYSERYAGYKADFICCRHVLEHIPRPHDFLLTLRRAIGGRPHAVVFFEVPNTLCILRDLAIWDIIYEHYSYFNHASLDHLFRSCGFEIHNLFETYEGQFLCIEALPGEHRTELSFDNWEELNRMVQEFAVKYHGKIAKWKRRLADSEAMGQRAVIWGIGSKGVTLLNTLNIRDQIEYVIDINPYKQGMYVVGTGQQIMPPEFLRDYRPDVVFVMNATYIDEIRSFLLSMGIEAQLIADDSHLAA
jgi:2-polyprenyl-3-methyl-5-hydroxy-6-metoxy-1,4-benzoquinol methylase